MLGGEPLAPLEYTPGALDAGGRKLEDNEAESIELEAAAAQARRNFRAVTGISPHRSS
jgi:hypothetical protein